MPSSHAETIRRQTLCAGGLASDSLTRATSVFDRRRSPNFAFTVEKAVSTLLRLWWWAK
jgi:hypothetical protein